MAYYLYKSGEAGGGFGDEVKYRDRAQITNFDGVTWVIAGADPGRQLYEAIEDATVDTYSTLVRTDLSFEGVEGDAAARVRETRVWERISIDDLRVAKEQELDGYFAFVIGANAQSTLNPNWVILVGDAQRTWINSVSARLLDRLERQIAYWARNIPITVVNKTTLNRENVAADRTQWTSVLNDISVHDFDSTDASGLVTDSIEQEYGQGDWDGLASINVQNPAWGWPPVYTG